MDQNVFAEIAGAGGAQQILFAARARVAPIPRARRSQYSFNGFSAPVEATTSNKLTDRAIRFMALNSGKCDPVKRHAGSQLSRPKRSKGNSERPDAICKAVSIGA
jgi:hypothetical protein